MGGGERPAPAHTRQVPVSARASPWRIGHIAQLSLLHCCRTDTPHTHISLYSDDRKLLQDPARTPISCCWDHRTHQRRGIPNTKQRRQEAAARRQHPQHQAWPVRYGTLFPLGRPTEAGALLMPSTLHFPEEFFNKR